MLNNNTDIKEVDKLSPVLIMEAYFNLFHKFLIGVYMMPTTEMTVEIPPDQYKRRKGHIKIESGLNKCIFFRIGIHVKKIIHTLDAKTIFFAEKNLQYAKLTK